MVIVSQHKQRSVMSEKLYLDIISVNFLLEKKSIAFMLNLQIYAVVTTQESTCINKIILFAITNKS